MCFSICVVSEATLRKLLSIIFRGLWSFPSLWALNKILFYNLYDKCYTEPVERFSLNFPDLEQLSKTALIDQYTNMIFGDAMFSTRLRGSIWILTNSLGDSGRILKAHFLPHNQFSCVTLWRFLHTAEPPPTWPIFFLALVPQNISRNPQHVYVRTQSTLLLHDRAWRPFGLAHRVRRPRGLAQRA